jgi:site-specific DNA-methyltransferase (adenine-specific)
LTYDETDAQEVCGGMPNTISSGGSGIASKVNTFANTYNGGWGHDKDCANLGGLGDSGSAARYFYCAKASQRDRDEGLGAFQTQKTGDLQGGRKEGSAGSIMQNADGGTRVNPYAGTGAPKKNIHPTVKPVDLMQYLIRLVTPKGGTVMDPFNGSGSTGKAAMYENKDRDSHYKYIGIELTPEYLPISQARIQYVINTKDLMISNAPKKIVGNQLNLFDLPNS